jgi:uncharacterized membrane protein YcaP (DUF421 family)
MFDSIKKFIRFLIGPDHPQHVTLFHTVARALLIFIVGMILVSIDKRFLGIKTPLDIIINIIIGAIFASTITANSSFLPSVAVCFFLVFMNWGLAVISFYSPILEQYIKGAPEKIAQDGVTLPDAMQRNYITHRDLTDAARQKGNTSKIEEIKEAYLESDGEISIINYK